MKKQTVMNKRLIPFLAFRQCIRDKRNFFVIVIGIIASIILLIVSVSANHYTLQKEVETSEQTSGNWHAAYLLNDPNAISQIKSVPGVKEVYQCFYIPDIKDDSYTETFQFLGITADKMQSFLPISQGVYPKNASEVVVPSWFLHKYNIETLPADIQLNGKTFHVVGAVDSNYNSTKFTVPVFLSLEANPELEKLGVPELPWGSSSPVSNDNQQTTTAHTSALISLEPGSNLQKTMTNIEANVKGIERFHAIDMLEIMPNSKETELTPIFNTNLIGLQNLKGIGKLAGTGGYAAIGWLNLIFVCIIVALGVVLIFTFLNIKKNETIHQYGILTAMGCSPGKIVAIQMLQIFIMYLLALPFGVGIGYLIAGGLVGFHYVVFSSTVLYGLIANAVCLVLPSLLLTAYIIYNTPITSITKQNTQKVIYKAEIKRSKLIECKRPFSFQFFYALRNIVTHKLRFIYTVLSITLLFCLFAVTLSQVNLYYLKGDTKAKYDYDLAITIKNGDFPIQPTEPFLIDLNKISGITQIMAPTCYMTYTDTYVNGNQPDRIVKGPVISVIPSEYITESFKQSLLKSEFETFVKDKQPNIWVDSGVLGCGKNELDYLKQHLVEGSVDPLLSGDKPYVLLPKYLEYYQNVNIDMTTLHTGDTITVNVGEDSDRTDSYLNPKFVKQKTYTIAGFVDINPFDVKNGNSTQFSLIMNTEQLKELVPPQVGKIYMKVKDADFDAVLKQVQGLIKDKPGYSIQNPREDTFQLEMQKKAADEQVRNIMIVILATSVVILIGLCNLLVIQILLRRNEIKLLRTVGLSARMIRLTVLIETFLFNLVGILLGVGISVFINQTLGTDAVLKNAMFIPWGIWAAVGASILAVCFISAYLSLLSLERSFRKEGPS